MKKVMLFFIMLCLACAMKHSVDPVHVDPVTVTVTHTFDLAKLNAYFTTICTNLYPNYQQTTTDNPIKTQQQYVAECVAEKVSEIIAM